MTTPDNDTASDPPLSLRQRLRVAILGTLGGWLLRLLHATWRVRVVTGGAHLQQLIDSGQPSIPCCWHGGISMVVPHMIAQQKNGLKLGFLISPSRDGALAARIVRGSGGHIVRGSAHRTGARAIRELYGVMKQEGISPMNHPDGPNGPAQEFKVGTVMLSQVARAPVLPIGFAADRYWQLRSWDGAVIPKPFARVALAFGEAVTVSRKLPLDGLEPARLEAQQALDAAMQAARKGLESTAA